MNQIVDGPHWAELIADTGALALFAYLSAENGPDSEFLIADGLGKARGWPRRFVPDGRNKLLTIGLVVPVRHPGKNSPGLYRWASDLDLPNLVGQGASDLDLPKSVCNPSMIPPLSLLGQEESLTVLSEESQRAVGIPIPAGPESTAAAADDASRSPQQPGEADPLSAAFDDDDTAPLPTSSTATWRSPR